MTITIFLEVLPGHLVITDISWKLFNIFNSKGSLPLFLECSQAGVFIHHFCWKLDYITGFVATHIASSRKRISYWQQTGLQWNSFALPLQRSILLLSFSLPRKVVPVSFTLELIIFYSIFLWSWWFFVLILFWLVICITIKLGGCKFCT